MRRLLPFVLATLLLLPSLLASSWEPTQEPPEASTDGSASWFRTSDGCMACHNLLVTPSGEDVSIGFDWRSSMMANSARDPYWQAGVQREVMDHPEAQEAIEGECSICHMPMARYHTRVTGQKGEIFAHLPIGQGDTVADHLAADGVSCTLCHQITDENLGEEESFVGHFVIDTTTPWGERSIYGPFDVDEGRTTIMRSASRFRPTQGTHIQESEVCATCHTLFTHALGPGGEVIGELPEQVPYLEWLHGDYRDQRSCQSCHMRKVEAEMPITSVWGQPRSGFTAHVFRGGNFFMPRIFNRYREELGVEALPQELSSASRRTVERLQSDAAELSFERAEVSGGRLRVDVAVENRAGHKLPTAYPSRRVWLHLTVRDGNGRLIFESGAVNASGLIEGNDNDEDPGRYEPHHTEIDSPDDVQIYEAILLDDDGDVTTGLLAGVSYGKDNRLLPRGFDKATADEDVAVRGAAATDADFRGGSDVVRYSVDVTGAGGPYQIEAQLWYQPIGFRWAENLKSYDTFLTNRFVSYYEGMSGSSAIVLTGGTISAR